MACDKTLLLVIEMAWLGVGPARIGVVLEEETITWLHRWYHGHLSEPYVPVGKSPVRFEIEATGSGTGQAEARGICATTLVENYDATVEATTTSHVTVYREKTVNTSGTEMFFRMRPESRMGWSLYSITAVTSGNSPITWAVYSCRSSSGGTWEPIDLLTDLEINETATCIDSSEDILLMKGMVLPDVPQEKIVPRSQVRNYWHPYMDGTPEVIMVKIVGKTGTVSVDIDLTFSEDRV